MFKLLIRTVFVEFFVPLLKVLSGRVKTLLWQHMNKRKISKSETLISSFTEQTVVWSVLPEKCGGERLKLNYASFQVARMFSSVFVRCITRHLLSPSLVVFIVLISNSSHTKSVMEVIQYGAAINIFVKMLVMGTGKIFPIQSHVSKQ
jgi:hypothetical protein